MIAWIKNLAMNQIETNPVIMPFFDESKGWRWFCRLHFLAGVFFLIVIVLLTTDVSGLLFSPMLEEQDSSKKIDTLSDWVLVVFFFFYFFGGLMYIGKVVSFSGKLILEKKIFPKTNFLKNYSPHNNFFSYWVGILLFFYLIFYFAPVPGFISFVFGGIGIYGRIIVLVIFIWGGGILTNKGIMWLDKQKPVYIQASFGIVVLMYFCSFVWMVNYS